MTRPAHSFLHKIAGAVLLIVLADLLLYDRMPGATLGAFALAWTLMLPLLVPVLRRSRPALVALGMAALFGCVLVDDPSLLGWSLFWLAISSAAPVARRPFDDAVRQMLRLCANAAAGLVRPPADAARLHRLGTGGLRRLRTLLAAAALPILGGAVFVALFAAANPLIESVLDAVRLPTLDLLSPFRIAFWGVVLVMLWPTMRPSARVLAFRGNRLPDAGPLPGVGIGSVTASLILFNALFAVQNGLDLAFLWSGAPLPQGVTPADYAHRGAYPLILTALLAGAFVLAATRPGTPVAARPLVRRLVVLWTLQNLVLVASSVVRTVDYVRMFMLTQWRIAALAWMALVALGLVLICWRMLRGRSLAWLVNANAAAAVAVLSVASVVDLGAVAAAWNVRHAREAGGEGQALDLCYLRSLGASALVPVARFEREPLPPRLADAVAALRQNLWDRTAWRQAQGWTWRNARRLHAAALVIGDHPRLPLPAPLGRDCDGTVVAPPTAAATPAPLTKGPAR